MIFRLFSYFDRGCAAYLFGCGSLGRCAVVDARADDVEAYLSFASQKGIPPMSRFHLGRSHTARRSIWAIRA